MKRFSIPALVLVAGVGLVLAQGLNMKERRGPIIGIKTRPPLSLPEAYEAALGHVGPATNRLWCISGSCGPDYGTTKVTHWEFRFSNMNNEITLLFI